MWQDFILANMIAPKELLDAKNEGKKVSRL
jgi:hypothetical protein